MSISNNNVSNLINNNRISFILSDDRDPFLELKICDNFLRYIKKDEFEEINNTIKATLDIDNIELDTVYNLDEYSQQSVAFVLDTLLYGGRSKIDLSDDTFLSVKGKPVIYTYRNLGIFKGYFTDNGHFLRFVLYKQLAQDIIEVPYIDDPMDYQLSKNGVSYHSNHGTGHAIRQAILTNRFFKYFKTNASDEFNKTITNITKESYLCLELASFLFRSGRTNEDSHSIDKIYAKRSAEIFKHIATELGFNEVLIDDIYDAMNNCFIDNNEHVTYSKSHDESMKIKQIYVALLTLAHESDLVRCNRSQDDISGRIADVLIKSNILNDDIDISKTSASFLNFACELCNKTGSPISISGHQLENVRGNRFQMIEVVNKIEKTFSLLFEENPTVLNEKYFSPTELWLRDEERLTSWTEENKRCVPSTDYIKFEQEYLDTHFSVAHATTRKSYALDLVCRYIKKIMGEDDKTVWIRTFNSMPKNTITNIQQMMERMDERKRTDHTANNAWHLLSCSPTLWHGSDVASEESCVNFFYNNCSVTQLDFKSIFLECIESEGIQINDEVLDTFYDEFEKIVSDDTLYGEQGVIYQYLIDKKLIDEVAYISRKGGHIDNKNPSAYYTLNSLRLLERDIPNYDSLQVRLFVPELLNQRNQEKIIVVNHMNLCPERKEMFESALYELTQTLTDFIQNRVEVTRQTRVENSTRHGFFFKTYQKRQQFDLSLFTKNNKDKILSNSLDSEEFILFADDTSWQGFDDASSDSVEYNQKVTRA